ncbi:MAG: DUF4860 domain-containing protein [Oscillospiraceae bacterium]|nr:DUF4860 domain-containing protein [Oscillospiraceae bacterium]
MKQNEKNPILLLSVGIAALFLLGFLLLVAFGARTYRDMVDSQYGNMDERALSAYIAASVKANDSRGALRVEDSDCGQVLVVADAGSGWALRYYRYEGQLVEDYARDGTPLAPEEAQRIGPTELFSVERGDNGLVTVITDAGRILLHTRSTEGAAS